MTLKITPDNLQKLEPFYSVIYNRHIYTHTHTHTNTNTHTGTQFVQRVIIFGLKC